MYIVSIYDVHTCGVLYSVYYLYRHILIIHMIIVYTHIHILSQVIVEVELTGPQKQYYRAIYEQNTQFLYRGQAKDGPRL